MIPVWRDKRVKGWPKNPQGAKATYQPLAEVLRTVFESDAHFAAYSAPHHPRRLNKEALPNTEMFPDGVAMVALLFDVDATESHKAMGGTGEPASDEWWLAQQPKIEALLVAHPGAFFYRTRGGYRIVYALDGVILHSPADADAWSSTYVALCAYLKRAFDILVDASCFQWNRLFRAPWVVRDGKRQIHEVIGSPDAIAIWTYEPSAEDFEIGKTLRRQRPKPKTHKPREERAAASVGDGVLFHAFQSRGMLGPQIEAGKWAIECPWSHEHSKGDRFDTSTVLFAPSAGEALGWPHCSHAHCARRDIRDWVGTFAEEELVGARDAAGVAPSSAYVEPQQAETASHERPTIIVRTDEMRVNDEAVAALAMLAGIYQRGGRLVEVIEVDGRRAIREMPMPRVRELLADAANFIVLKEDTETGCLVEVPAFVPDWCVRAVHVRGEWPGLPRLVGLLDAPALRPDGTVIQELGLDTCLHGLQVGFDA